MKLVRRNVNRTRMTTGPLVVIPHWRRRQEALILGVCKILERVYSRNRR